MAEATTTSKIDAAAEKAYAEAAAKKATPAKAAPAKSAPAKTPAAKKPAVATKPAAKATATKRTPAKKTVAATTAAKKPAARKAAVKKAPAKKTPVKKAPAKKVAAKKADAATSNPITKLKDTIMATAEKNDITAQAKDMAADVQEPLKTAYAKTGEFAGELGELTEHVLDLVVRAGRGDQEDPAAARLCLDQTDVEGRLDLQGRLNRCHTVAKSGLSPLSQTRLMKARRLRRRAGHLFTGCPAPFLCSARFQSGFGSLTVC